MTHKPSPAIALWAATIIIALQVVVGLAVYVAFDDWQTRGQFGDVFGAVNALFSGLAFAGLIYTVLLQREELSLQRKELELTRQELRRSAHAQEQAEIALRAQAISTARTARLSAANFLLSHYKLRLTPLIDTSFPRGDPRFAERNDLIDRINVLTGVLDAMYDEVSQEAEIERMNEEVNQNGNV